MIAFLHPVLLFLLGALPVVALLKGRRGQAAAVRFSSVSVAQAVAKARRTRPGRFMATLRLLALALLIVASARPQMVHSHTDVETSGIDVMLAVDVSSSMEALDFEVGGKPVRRIDVVKRVVSQFAEERPNDRLGLIAFAGRAYMLTPLTLDHEWLQQRLEALDTGIVEDGTAIGSAIATSANRLREDEAESRIVILLTDGMNNTGKVTPLTAAEAAAALGIKIYTIGAGSRGEAPLPVKNAFGETQMRMAKVDIDEETLTQVADMTGGKYFRATDTDSLQRIYDEINELETTTRTLKQYSSADELFGWAVIPALLLLLLERLLTLTRFRRLP